MKESRDEPDENAALQLIAAAVALMLMVLVEQFTVQIRLVPFLAIPTSGASGMRSCSGVA